MLKQLIILIRFGILLIFFFIPTTLFSQDKDLKLWTGFSLEHKLSKQIKFSLGIEQRFNSNISSFDKYLFEPGISYKLNKRLSFELIYRGWIPQSDDNNYGFKQRGKLSTSYKLKKIKQFKIRFTSAIQYGIPDLNSNNINYTNDLVTRNNIKIAYDIFGTRFSPFIKFELFTSLKRLEFLNYQWRYLVGTDYALSHSSSIRFFWAIEHEFNIVYPMNSYIIGMMVSYELE